MVFGKKKKEAEEFYARQMNASRKEIPIKPAPVIEQQAPSEDIYKIIQSEIKKALSKDNLLNIDSLNPILTLLSVLEDNISEIRKYIKGLKEDKGE